MNIKRLSKEDIISQYGSDFLECLRNRKSKCSGEINEDGLITFYNEVNVASDDGIKKIKLYFKVHVGKVYDLANIDVDPFDTRNYFFFEETNDNI